MNSLTLPTFTDEGDPRRDWILDLIQPRLSKITALAWSCTEDLSAVDIDLKGLGTECEDFLKVNFPVPVAHGSKMNASRTSAATCRRGTQIRIPLREKRCDPNARPELMGRLRLPPGTGLYTKDSDAHLKPRFPNLPTLEFSAHPLMNTPAMEAWLGAAGFKGAVLLFLELSRLPQPVADSQIPTLLSAVKTHLTKARPPRHLRPSPELVMSQSSASEAVKPPLVNVTDAYNEPLLKESCRYVNRWIKARQLLSAPGEIDETRQLELTCQFRWSEDPVPDNSIILARLPIPLEMEDGSYFPFKTVEDALSPSLFQSLKLPR